MSFFTKSPQLKFPIAVLVAFLLALSIQFAPIASAKQAKPSATGITNTNSCASPPANFDPLKASNAELQSYGLPMFVAGSNKTQWTNTLRHAKHRICSPAKSSNRYSLGDPRLQSSQSGSTGTTPNWSGYAESGQSYYEIQGYWIWNPYISGNTPSDSDEVTWVGLGGYGGGKLLQVGTTDGRVSGPGLVWWEEYPKNSMQIVGSLICNPGDTMYAEVWYTNNQDNVYIEDQGNGSSSCGLYYSQVVDTGFAPSHTAEWVDERTACNGTNYYKLSDFGSVNWSYDYGLYGSGQETDAGQATQITMLDYNGKPLAVPGSVNSEEGFTDTWKANGTSRCG